MLHFLFNLAKPGFNFHKVLLCGKHFLIDGAVPGKVLVLGEVADGCCFGNRDLAFVCGKFPEDDP